MAGQLKIPGCAPTPAQAKQKLREARQAARASWSAVMAFEDHLKATKGELEAAEAELETAERNMLDGEEGSPEVNTAEADQNKAWKRMLVAERAIEQLKATLGTAKVELADARRRLRGAREDVSSCRMGARKR